MRNLTRPLEVGQVFLISLDTNLVEATVAAAALGTLLQECVFQSFELETEGGI